MNFREKYFKKSPLKYFPFLLVVLGNLWIWRMFSENLLIGISAVLASWSLYLSIKEDKLEKLLIVFLLILFGFQIKNTNIRSLSYLNKQEQVIQLQRLNEYSPVKFTLAGKTIWVPLAHWLEERPETLALYRIQENLSGVLNPNLYFFANHPNERVGIKEHEKFPYILLPFFVLGLLCVDIRKNRTILSFFIFTPILLVAFAGNYFDVEPISFFPFIAVLSALGIEYAWGKVSRLIPTKLKGATIGTSLLFYALVFIQSWLFDKF